jgi:Glycosyltransferase family 87
VSSAGPGTRTEQHRRLVLGGLGVFIIAFAAFALAHILPPAPYGLADDWRVFYGAAHAVQQGGNPYDVATIHAAEQAAQHYPHVQRSLDDFTDLPIVAVLLRAVTWLPYWSSFAAFTMLGLLAAGVALLAWVRELGWRRPAPWLIAALCSWPMLLGFFSGQFDALLLAGLVAGLLFMRRDKPVLAGLCMVVVLFKPHLLWPVPVLLFAAWLPARKRRLRFAAATAAVLLGGGIAGFLLVPGATSFFQHAFGFGSRIGSVQPDLAGLPGLVNALPGHTLLAAAIAIAGAVLVLSLATFSPRIHWLRALPDRSKPLVPLVGLAVWLACTPYAHPNDDVLLLPLLALVVGAEGEQLDVRWLQPAVLACVVTVAAFLAAPAVGYAALLLGVTLLVALRRRVTPDAMAALALVAFALLPVVWPFHVLAVSLTPVAVTLAAFAGIMRWRSVVLDAAMKPAAEKARSHSSVRTLVEA